MRKSLPYFTLILSVAVLLAGCATLIQQPEIHWKVKNKQNTSQITKSNEEKIYFSYIGVRRDLEMIMTPYNCKYGNKIGGDCFLIELTAPGFIIIGLIDLPLSTIADTLILPYTLYRDLKDNE